MLKSVNGVTKHQYMPASYVKPVTIISGGTADLARTIDGQGNALPAGVR